MSEPDHILMQQIERDICLFYHRQADYRAIMGDLDYGSVYALAYWTDLDLEGLPEERRRFIRQGCLMMVLAMAWDRIDGSGGFLNDLRIEDIERALSTCPVDDDADVKLLETVQLAIATAKAGGHESADLTDRPQ